MNPGYDIDDLKAAMLTLIQSSPNAKEPLAAYKSKDSKDVILEIRVKWATEGRDPNLFPRETKLTDNNVEPVLRMMQVGIGRDVFDIRLDSQKA